MRGFDCRQCSSFAEAIGLFEKAWIVLHMMIPQFQNSSIVGEPGISESYIVPHRLAFPVAIDVGPHGNVVIINEIQDGDKPFIPWIFQVRNASKGRRFSNHDGFFYRLGKFQNISHIIDVTKCSMRVKLLKETNAHPIHKIISGIIILQRLVSW